MPARHWPAIGVLVAGLALVPGASGFSTPLAADRPCVDRDRVAADFADDALATSGPGYEIRTRSTEHLSVALRAGSAIEATGMIDGLRALFGTGPWTDLPRYQIFVVPLSTIREAVGFAADAYLADYCTGSGQAVLLGADLDPATMTRELARRLAVSSQYAVVGRFVPHWWFAATAEFAAATISPLVAADLELADRFLRSPWLPLDAFDPGDLNTILHARGSSQFLRYLADRFGIGIFRTGLARSLRDVQAGAAGVSAANRLSGGRLLDELGRFWATRAFPPPGSGPAMQFGAPTRLGPGPSNLTIGPFPSSGLSAVATEIQLAPSVREFAITTTNVRRNDIRIWFAGANEPLDLSEGETVRFCVGPGRIEAGARPWPERGALVATDVSSRGRVHEDAGRAVVHFSAGSRPCDRDRPNPCARDDERPECPPVFRAISRGHSCGAPPRPFLLKPRATGFSHEQDVLKAHGARVRRIVLDYQDDLARVTGPYSTEVPGDIKWLLLDCAADRMAATLVLEPLTVRTVDTDVPVDLFLNSTAARVAMRLHEAADLFRSAGRTTSRALRAARERRGQRAITDAFARLVAVNTNTGVDRAYDRAVREP
jgi:hypothetical protein